MSYTWIGGGRPTFRRSFEIHTLVCWAVFLKELSRRFGKSRIGIFWVFLEPALFVAFLSFLWHLGGRESFYNIPVPLFIALGYLPYMFLRWVIGKAAKKISNNESLYDFPQVKPFDVFVAGFMLELVIFIVASPLFMLCMWWFFDYSIAIARPVEFFVYALIFLVGVFGLGLILGILICFFDLVSRMTRFINRALMFTSSIWHPYNELPTIAQQVLQWNPLLQYIELMRSAYFGYTNDPGISAGYAALVSISLLGFALVLYYPYRYRLIMR